MKRHLRSSDLRACAGLAVEATRGITTVVEGVHQAVWGTLAVPGGAARGQTRGLTGLVYRSVHGITALVGRTLQTALIRIEPWLAQWLDAPAETPEREAVLAALNGVLGDRLAQHHNPLATPMTLRCHGVPWPDVATPLHSKVVLLVHGLCMNDLQWRTQPQGPQGPQGTVVDYGQLLGQALGATPVTVRYNTGLHISENGALLSAQLEQLAHHWPAGLTELRVVAHSMGGLVTRSAVHHAHQNHLTWPKKLKAIVFLGTPHHGAPLERAGNWIDHVLGATAYSRPFAALGQLRSAGITDLRYGHVLDADWQGRDRFHRQSDTRTPCPLPAGVACFTVAATTARQRSPLAERILGDGLVPLASALGAHTDPAYHLHFDAENQTIAYGTHHMQLLSSPAVGTQMVQWLSR